MVQLLQTAMGRYQYQPDVKHLLRWRWRWHACTILRHTGLLSGTMSRCSCSSGQGSESAMCRTKSQVGQTTSVSVNREKIKATLVSVSIKSTSWKINDGRQVTKIWRSTDVHGCDLKESRHGVSILQELKARLEKKNYYEKAGWHRLVVGVEMRKSRKLH